MYVFALFLYASILVCKFVCIASALLCMLVCKFVCMFVYAAVRARVFLLGRDLL